MGGSRQKSKLSIFNLFRSSSGGARPRRSSADHDHACNWDDAPTASKVWPSDGDKGRHWVADPGIDRKATAYIDKIHQLRFSQTERHTVMLPSANP